MNAAGELFFADVPNHRIHKVNQDGTVSNFAEKTDGANGLMFGPDGRLYAGATATKQIVAYDASGKREVIADAVPEFVRGLQVTLILLVVACLSGFVLSVPLAVARVSPNPCSVSPLVRHRSVSIASSSGCTRTKG